MRILVHEFVSGGGLVGQPRPASLAREGAAMLEALLADLSPLPGCRVTATVDPRARLRVPPGVRAVALRGDPREELRALLRQSDAVWIIAPETRGRLAELGDLAEAEGCPPLGPPAAAIRQCADKRRLAELLVRSGTPAPRTLAVASTAAALTAAEALGFPVVLKPSHGAGCEGVGLARSPAELETVAAAALRAADTVLVQQYLPGTHASVALLVGGEGAVPLCLNLQRVDPGPRFRYRGGETPLEHPVAELALRRAAEACRLIPGLRGWVGVDLVLSEADAAVIEINPRLTTSYLGARVALDANLADLALRACSGESPTPPPTRRRVRHDASGTIRELGPIRA